jgi:hypothetical protein
MAGTVLFINGLSIQEVLSNICQMFPFSVHGGTRVSSICYCLLKEGIYFICFYVHGASLCKIRAQ